MIRSTLRLSASINRSLLMGSKAEAFLTQIEKRLHNIHNGQDTAAAERISYWESISQGAKQLQDIIRELQQLETLRIDTKDVELLALAEDEKEEIDEKIDKVVDDLATRIVPTTEVDVLGKCQMEFTSGAGGQEAMLFTGELLEMYRRYSEWKGWKWDILQMEDVSLGGIRNAVIGISGPLCYSLFRFEAGVHRVQRIPLTDKSRMHTSTASISVLPEPEEISVVVPTQSVKIETMRASGPGGQNVNKRSTAVRLTHKETGITVHCMDERFQHLNLQIAFKRLAAILMQQKIDETSEKFSSDRKIQVGSKARAEKIRTYNFQHDRITDHRIHMQVGNIEEFMKGEEELNGMICRLSQAHMSDRLRYIIDNCHLE